jgi:hypothetical protein
MNMYVPLTTCHFPGPSSAKTERCLPGACRNLGNGEGIGPGLHSGGSARAVPVIAGETSLQRCQLNDSSPSAFANRSFYHPVDSRLVGRNASCTPPRYGSCLWAEHVTEQPSTTEHRHRSTWRHIQMSTRLQAKRVDPFCPRARDPGHQLALSHVDATMRSDRG